MTTLTEDKALSAPKHIAEKGCGKRFPGTGDMVWWFCQIVQMLLSLNSLVQGISQGIFCFEARKPQIMPKMRKIALEAGKEQGIQEISPKATEELGVTCCFEAKAAERSGKKQGISVFTLQLNHAETGISFIQFIHRRFSANFQRSEAVPSAVLKTSASAPRQSEGQWSSRRHSWKPMPLKT